MPVLEERVEIRNELFYFLQNIIDRKNNGRLKDCINYVKLNKKDLNGSFSIFAVRIKPINEIFMHGLEPLFQLDLYNDMQDNIHIFCDYLGDDINYSINEIDSVKSYFEKLLHSLEYLKWNLIKKF